MPHCPVEGCDVTFEKKQSTIAHVQGSGGIHKGHGFNDARKALENGESLPAATGDSSEGSSGSSPGSGDGDGMGMPGGGDGGGGGDEVDCPGCGEPMGAPSELEEAGLVKCSECGKGPMRYSR